MAELTKWEQARERLRERVKELISTEEEVQIPQEWLPDDYEPPKKALLNLRSLIPKMPKPRPQYLSRSQKVKKLTAFLLIITYIFVTYWCIVDGFYSAVLVPIPTTILLFDYIVHIKGQDPWSSRVEEEEE